MTKALDFLEVASLINHSRITEIDINPLVSEKGKWALFHGFNKVPNFKYPFDILYLYSGFTKESAFTAAHAIVRHGSTQVIYAPSLREDYLTELKKQLSLLNDKEIAGFFDLKSYLLSFIQDQLKVYIKNIITELEPKFFVDPPYKTPSGFKSRFPNPVYSFLTDNVDDVKDGALGILLAEPGQGKTYTAMYLASTLASSNFIPIYIHSPQWFNMKEEDLSSLYKTITYSFRYFDSPLDWIEGVEDLFINVTLKLGVFRIIFDGFDEYILWNKGKLTPNEIIYNLYNLAEQSNSRILITSRTTFWNSNITDEEQYKQLFKYLILPFDTNHASNYFNLRLKGKDAAINRAIIIFNSLKNIGRSDLSSSFAGRGIILNLIADLSVETEVINYDGNTTIFQWIIKALCQREEKRQRLPINAEQQLSVLRLFAEYKATGKKPTSELLSEILHIICDKLTMEEIHSMVGFGNVPKSLQDHPLIFKTNESDIWKFKHEQIEFNLLSEQIILYSKENLNNTIKKLFNDLNNDGSILDDLCSVIYEQISTNTDESKAEIQTASFLKKIIYCCELNSVTPNIYSNIVTLTTKLLLDVLNKNRPIGGSKVERMKELLSYFDNNELLGLQFSGTLSSLDFSKITISNCRFENVSWSNCKFSAHTKFKDCNFISGSIHNCNNFGESHFESCQYDAEAESMISYEILKLGNKKVSKEDVQRDIQLFIKRFMPKEGLFKSVHKENILRGTFAVSPYKNDLLSVMKKYIIEEHTVSHSSGIAYHIRAESKESIKNYLTNNIFSGELLKAYHDLCRELGAD